MKMRIKRWELFFLMLLLLLTGMFLLRPEMRMLAKEPDGGLDATSTDAVSVVVGNGGVPLLPLEGISAYTLTGSKSFTEISRIPYWSRSGSTWQTEVFFVKDSTWSSQANAGNYYWYPNFSSTYTTVSQVNAFMDSHTVAYCVESGALNPCDSGSSAATTLAASSNALSATQRQKLANVVANGYPANKAYWAEKGLSYLQQASATQMAIWYWTDVWGISGNTGAVSPYTITCTNSTMKEMYDYLITCGNSASATSIKADAAIPSASVTKSGNNFVYTWNVKLSGCYWNTQLSFSTVPSGATVTVDGTRVTLSNGTYTTSKNGATVMVRMTIPASGNTNRLITLTATPNKPKVTTSNVSYFAYSGSVQDMISWDDSYQMVSNPAFETLTSPAYGGRISFYKWDENNRPLSGATFGIYTDAAFMKPATVYTDDILSTVKKDGYLVTAGYAVQSGWLAPGTYHIREISAPAGYGVNTSIPSVQVVAGGSKAVSVTDTPLKAGQISLIKEDSVSGTLVPGAVFGIYEDEDCLKPATVYTDSGCTKEEPGGYQLTIGSDGSALSGYLHEGTYHVREISAPDGYQLSVKVTECTVASGQVTSMTLTDTPWNGSVTVTKRDSVTDAVLPGAAFTVYEGSGSGWKAVGTLTDNGNGAYTSGKLYWTKDNQGMFRVEESAAPAHHVNAGWSQEFELTESDKTQYFSFTLTNQPSMFRFIKVTEDGSPLAGCTFELRDEAGTVIDTWTTDGTGIHEVTGMLQPGDTYTLIETEVPLGYEKASDLTFTAEEKAGWVEIRTVNRKLPASVAILKQDGTGKPLSGVTFALYTTQTITGAETFGYDGMTFYRLMSAVTDEDGKAGFTGLPSASGYHYLFIEEDAADGHALLSEPVYIGELPATCEGEPDVSYGGNVQLKDGVYYLYDLTYTVTDGTGFTLPMTGGTGFGITIIRILAASAFPGALLLSDKNKKRKGETRS